MCSSWEPWLFFNPLGIKSKTFLDMMGNIAGDLEEELASIGAFVKGCFTSPQRERELVAESIRRYVKRQEERFHRLTAENQREGRDRQMLAPEPMLRCCWMSEPHRHCASVRGLRPSERGRWAISGYLFDIEAGECLSCSRIESSRCLDWDAHRRGPRSRRPGQGARGGYHRGRRLGTYGQGVHRGAPPASGCLVVPTSGRRAAVPAATADCS